VEKLAFRKITEYQEIEIFLQRFQDYVGVKLPTDYVERSTIVGVFLNKRMVGGYMLVLSPGFRSLLFVPDEIKRQTAFFSNNLSEMMEINGLWISSSLRNPKLQLAVWFHLVANIFLSKRKFILLLRDARNKSMRRLLSLAKPILLYEGAPLLMAGHITHDRIQVSYTTRWSILLHSYHYWLELRSRQQRVSLISPLLSRLSRYNTTKPTAPHYVK
jgi:hypothetical protein